MSIIAADFHEFSPLELTCSLTMGNYSSVTLLKIADDNTELPFVVFYPNGSNEIVASQNGTVARFTYTNSSVLMFTIERAACDDEGTYACRHDNGQTSMEDIGMQGDNVNDDYDFNNNDNDNTNNYENGDDDI